MVPAPSCTPTVSDPRLFLGLDLGTSGVRAVVIDADGAVRATARAPLPPSRRDGARVTQDPTGWWQGVRQVLQAVLARMERAHLAAIAVDGTSGTLLLTDSHGQPLTPALMYDDAACLDEAARIAAVAPPDTAARGPACALARLLHLQDRAPQAAHALHQADWIAGRLAGRFGASDEHNALKLGHDPVRRCWPDWLRALRLRRGLLPRVQAPGAALGRLAPAMAREFGLRSGVQVLSGTTDGVAAFLATGASRVGEAVTSLGSTLVLKVLSQQPVCAPEYGVYSHRLGGLWLAGGASNSGGSALLRHFSAERMAELTPRLRPEAWTGLDYYPLPAPGERFPINDPSLPPRVSPRPEDDARFFQGLLEGIAQVEALGYRRIAELGGPRPLRVLSVGGGARNPAWLELRRRCLGVPVDVAAQEEAAYGTALLARRSLGAAPRQDA
ncbi:FGGY-family carbohydrate kinase [Azohydromonas caseinilytica]|uniref:FGGY-family carbohydrate kinase n=1 Tax=Azohydromonas caseinilytica TaxID=2728836 RepID=A0A848FGM7_9BURK|nr:FGGY-family carbohydrate kinase [Azohydromonas caseinilytica]NML18608.1 FGGY-family carbohydrate kinase [Azohydromonas caseinilytica]